MLFGKTVIVTGVASGIGARAAAFMAQSGADVIGIDIREPQAGSGQFVQADLGAPDAIAALPRRLPGRAGSMARTSPSMAGWRLP